MVYIVKISGVISLGYGVVFEVWVKINDLGIIVYMLLCCLK